MYAHSVMPGADCTYQTSIVMTNINVIVTNVTVCNGKLPSLFDNTKNATLLLSSEVIAIASRPTTKMLI